MHDLLREELGFDGLVISDALDMRALAQGSGQIVDLIAALRAGIDLLLCAPDRSSLERTEEALRLAARRELFDPTLLVGGTDRIAALRDWLGSAPQPALEVVGGADHLVLARELAERSVTLVRNDAGLLPLRLSNEARVLAVMPQPANMTPADTSATVAPGLAAAIRKRHPLVDEVVTGLPPTPGEIAGLKQRVGDYALVVVGTINAWFDSGQANLLNELLGSGVPVVTVALRVPFDLARYSTAATHVCTYSILPPSLDALVSALWGDIPFQGRLPAAIPGQHPTGHGLDS